MANIQIPNLPAVASLSGAELFEGVQAGTSVKISLDQVIAASRGGTPTTLPLAVSVGGTGADNPADARTNLGLGTISTQNSNSVTITGGSITGITDLAVADGGTGVSTLTGYVKGNGTSPFTASATVPSTDITGLGTMSVQNASSVTITGGSITGITDLAVADGGTGLSTYTVGDILYASAISTLAKLPDVATGNALISGGVGVAPLYGKIGLTTHVSGVLTVSNGGTGASTLTGYVKGSGTATLTASATIPNTDITGLGTMSVQNASSVTITGGSINGTAIGASSASTIKATTGNFSGDLTLESAQPTIVFAETDTTDIDARVRLNGGALIFDTTTDGGVLLQENMRITSVGRVGIGTTGPAAKLDVVGSTIISGDLTVDTNTLYVDSSNNRVGVGTITPSSDLDIAGVTTETRTLSIGAGRSGNGSSNIQLVGDTTYSTYGLRIERGNGGANAASTISHRGTGIFSINSIDAGSIEFYTTNTRAIRIGPTQTVTMDNLAGTGSRAVNASATGVLSAASDSRLKHEVEDAIIPGLAEIMQLKPRAYQWLDDIEKRGENASVEIGFFADQVKDIIPSAAPMGNDGYYGFYDRSVVAALTKAVQEQQSIIVALEARLTALEKVR